MNTVTPSKYYSITDIGAAVDPNSGIKSDVKTFQIKPAPNARNESITFILVGGKNLTFKFTPAVGGDKFYDVIFEQKKKLSKSFMNQEMSMMQSMILDQNGGFSRRIIEEGQKRKLDNYEFTLKEIYRSSDFTGYVFDIKNRLSEQQKINLSQFSFSSPNKAVMAHVNREELQKCPFFGSDSDCTTRLQVIVKGTDKQGLSILSQTSIPPFESLKEEGKR